MKVRLLLALAPLILLSMSAMAQTDNCCHVDRLCITNDEWVAGYWAYQRNQCPAQAQPQASSASQPSADIDNCCFVDRQCTTDDEWVAGYWAFQNNECAAPAQQRQSQVEPKASESQIDNCCFIGWQCSTDEEWVSGYWAFQHDRCDASQADWQAEWRQRRQKQELSDPKPNGWGGWCPPDCISSPISVETKEPGKYTYTYDSGDKLEIWHHTWDEFCELVEDKHPTCTPGYGNNNPVRIETFKA